MEAERKKVLLVDDEVDFAQTLGFWLKSQDFEVILSNNGERAIQVIKDDNPDIVFLDVLMPGIDGIETLKRIRKFNKDIPIIMLTAHTTDKRILEAEMLGVSGFFRKSSDFSHVTKMVQASLRSLIDE